VILSEYKKGGVKFGTSGVRGLVSDLTSEVCYAFTQAFLRSADQKNDFVVVGHDLRPSSPSIAKACIKAIHDQGLKALYVGQVPTPALALKCLAEQTLGIMITGSHIPFDRNGLKFYRADGEISKFDEQAIMASDISIPKALDLLDLPDAELSCISAYEKRYIDWFSVGSLSGMVIGVYEHSSVARQSLKSILSQLGANVISLSPSDDFIPIDTEAFRQEDIESGIEWADLYTLDAICSTDGDGDRPMFADENGKWLRGDLISVLCAKYLGVNAICTPVSSNTVLEKSFYFDVIKKTKIGSPYVIDAMLGLTMNEANLVAGYEANGGFLLGSDLYKEEVVLNKLPTRDAVLPMITLLVEANATNQTVSELFLSLPSRFTASHRLQDIDIASVKSFFIELTSDLSEAGKFLVGDESAVVKLNETDGIRFTFRNDVVIHLRVSGNAPELRCYTEANSEQMADQICQDTLLKVSEHLRLMG